jgi:hypothetical protein
MTKKYNYKSVLRLFLALAAVCGLLAQNDWSGLTATPTRDKSMLPPPVLNDIIINEYAADGDDFVELLVITDNLDLRGLRISDNELTTPGGTLNNNESVLVFGTDAFLSSVPRGRE